MPDDKDEVRGFDKQEEEEDAADLPQREAMSLLLDPTALVGGGLVPSSPTAPGSTPTPTEPGSTLTPAPPTAPTPGSDVATPAGPVSCRICRRHRRTQAEPTTPTPLARRTPEASRASLA